MRRLGGLAAGERRWPTAFGGARGSRRGAWGRLNSADAAMGNAAPFLSLGGMSPAPAPRCLLWCAAHRKCLGCGVCVLFLICRNSKQQEGTQGNGYTAFQTAGFELVGVENLREESFVFLRRFIARKVLPAIS